MTTELFLTLIIACIVVALLIINALWHAIFLVKQAEVVIIERFGKYHKMLSPGLHLVIPFVDQPRTILWTQLKEMAGGQRTYRYTELIERIDLRESVYDFPKQNVITKDNVTMEINALLFFHVTDPLKVAYEVTNQPLAIEKLAQTTLRNVIGSMDLDETLSSRDLINTRLREILDEATEKWGVKVTRVELQELTPPEDIRIAMEKQMRAERDKRALILESEGKKQAAILDAEGYKEAEIMRATGDAQARIKLAEAEAETITVIQKAIPGADPLPYLIATSYIKTLPEVLKGKEGKTVVIPYESSQLIGSLSTIKEIFK